MKLKHCFLNPCTRWLLNTYVTLLTEIFRAPHSLRNTMDLQLLKKMSANVEQIFLTENLNYGLASHLGLSWHRGMIFTISESRCLFCLKLKARALYPSSHLAPATKVTTTRRHFPLISFQKFLMMLNGNQSNETKHQ